MKRYSILSLALLAFLVACNESDDINPADVDSSSELTTSEDIANLQYLGQEIDLIVDEIADTRDPGDCPDVTLLYPQGKFPNTITIDFGDSCVRRHDHVLSGVIVVEISAPHGEEGSVRTTTFEGFAIDGILHSGTRTITNIAVDDEGNITLLKEVDVQLEFPTGQIATRTAAFTLQQTAGGSTPYKYDDVWVITGSSEGVNRNGDTYTATITEQLVHPLACRWIISGIMTTEVMVEGMFKTHTLNFGYPAGECDNLALLTLDSGDEKVIRVRRRWW